MNRPLVSVVCLCHNHEDFVADAISSIQQQTYPNIEIIVVDDASTDRSVDIISEIAQAHPKIQFLSLPKNHGNCRAFNIGFERTTGDFIIDLAADDRLLPHRIDQQVSLFEELPSNYGVIFSDARYIDALGNPLGGHFHGPRSKVRLERVPSGNLYARLVGEYIIPAPTMMIRRGVFQDLNGYDETLAYEDFDFWVRSSRNYFYQFQDQILTEIRRVKGSMSTNQSRKGDEQLRSTYQVCLKARDLNESEEESRALQRRLRYEFRHALWIGKREEAELFYALLKEVTSLRPKDKLIKFLGGLIARSRAIGN